MLSSIPKCEKAMVYLPENIPELDKLHSGMPSRAVGWASRLMNQHYVLNTVSSNKNTHKTGLCIYLLMKLL